MKHTIRVKFGACAAGFLLLTAASALAIAGPRDIEHTDSTAQACKTDTAKFVIQASLLVHWYDDKWDGWEKDPVKTADDSVRFGLMFTRTEMESIWPGFYDWAVSELLHSWRYKIPPDQLSRDVLLDCIERWS